MGKAGTRLNNSKARLISAKSKTKQPGRKLAVVRLGNHSGRIKVGSRRMATMTVVTAGPATAIQNSSRGSSLIRSNEATPPIG